MLRIQPSQHLLPAASDCKLHDLYAAHVHRNRDDRIGSHRYQLSRRETITALQQFPFCEVKS